MKPGPMYQQFAGMTGAEQQAVTNLIATEQGVEKIFFLGSATVQRRTESLFTTVSASAGYAGHLYLLVLVTTTDGHTQACLQDKLEKRAEAVLPTTTLIIDMERFNQWLAAGHPWAACVRQRARLLYDRERIPFSQPGTVDEEALKKDQDRLFRHSRTRVTEFLAGAELFRLRVKYCMAAFMLHQAAEQALRALLILRTGLRINTHSLEKLLRYCSMFCHPLPDVFPVRTEDDKKRFGLLQKAYIDARYSEEYTITEKDLLALTEKVKRIQALFEQYGAATRQP